VYKHRVGFSGDYRPPPLLHVKGWTSDEKKVNKHTPAFITSDSGKLRVWALMYPRDSFIDEHSGGRGRRGDAKNTTRHAIII